MLPVITLQPFHHRGAERMGIFFTPDPVLLLFVKRLSDARWSRTHCCWYLPLTETHYRQLVQGVAGRAHFNKDLLKTYLEQRKAVYDYLPKQPTLSKTQSTLLLAAPLHPENITALTRFVEQLRLKAYSESTIKTYRNEFLAFLRRLGNHAVANLTPEHLRRYLLYCLEKEKVTEATVHSRLNALKFYFEQVLGQTKMFIDLPRPKKPLLLPKVLGEQEISRLFNAVSFRKHKAILFTAYSAGLRVSEVTALELAHIDSDRMQIFVSRAKGKKDRYVGLSLVLLDVLRQYLRSCKRRPVKFLFESDLRPGEAYNSRTAQRVFQVAREKAGIHKQVSFHCLRHSFATHLLEKGIDIRYIKDLLGHFDIRTTERYLHVRKDKLVNIGSPFDDVWERGGIEW